MRLTYAGKTDVGMIRSGNEDNYAVDATATRGIFIVADGMGGHAAGEVASEMAVTIVGLVYFLHEGLSWKELERSEEELEREMAQEFETEIEPLLESDDRG